MTLTLDALFAGPLASHADALQPAQATDVAMPLPALLNPDTLGTLLERFAPGHSSTLRRPLVSEWSRHYFSRLMPPVTATLLLTKQPLALRLEDLSLILDVHGRPHAFRHHGLPQPAVADSALATRVAPLLDAHLSPLIEALAAYARLSPRVFWSNAANYAEWTISTLSSHLSEASAQEAHALVDEPQRPNGSTNPWHRPVTYVERRDAQGRVHRWRRRRICCLRYQIPDTAMCANCPLHTADQDKLAP
ncbi:siderophore-iron reductase FhuF [Achromobacter sp. GG226]|uniref:siderophore-iron reductase FhuF n=1 Tax=Verticiella alkaliphila TaxID=2779529 RepID=UPI001C0B865A|nr:siderophore-iron reductase FhuF [Verticiella sp. GG226]MBU4612577.1 siderophore-iron reductase FhuF [Verticiella sp. GG226]